PMAMLPFCGYNMADYFSHWLSMGRKMKNPPKIFTVNWFRTDENGKFIWPGFGENIRVLKWIIERVNNKVSGRETPIGIVPHLKDIETTGIEVQKEKLESILNVDIKEWKEELEDIKKFFESFGKRFPQQLWQEYEKLNRQAL
ncbi:MAG: phosphoenolpyruvate carboxykinase (GTP), partial [Candidatus Omnitrophica bacterium]|nr:phosphoenolpyruvate carboxykinase (GTP) [Candidatus Omnitrophota bacterium]